MSFHATSYHPAMANITDADPKDNATIDIAERMSIDSVSSSIHQETPSPTARFSKPFLDDRSTLSIEHHEHDHYYVRRANARRFFRFAWAFAGCVIGPLFILAFLSVGYYGYTRTIVVASNLNNQVIISNSFINGMTVVIFISTFPALHIIGDVIGEEWQRMLDKGRKLDYVNRVSSLSFGFLEKVDMIIRGKSSRQYAIVFIAGLLISAVRLIAPGVMTIAPAYVYLSDSAVQVPMYNLDNYEISTSHPFFSWDSYLYNMATFFVNVELVGTSFVGFRSPHNLLIPAYTYKFAANTLPERGGLQYSTDIVTLNYNCIWATNFQVLSSPTTAYLNAMTNNNSTDNVITASFTAGLGRVFHDYDTNVSGYIMGSNISPAGTIQQVEYLYHEDQGITLVDGTSWWAISAGTDLTLDNIPSTTGNFVTQNYASGTTSPQNLQVALLQCPPNFNISGAQISIVDQVVTSIVPTDRVNNLDQWHIANMLSTGTLGIAESTPIFFPMAVTYAAASMFFPDYNNTSKTGKYGIYTDMDTLNAGMTRAMQAASKAYLGSFYLGQPSLMNSTGSKIVSGLVISVSSWQLFASTALYGTMLLLLLGLAMLRWGNESPQFTLLNVLLAAEPVGDMDTSLIQTLYQLRHTMDNDPDIVEDALADCDVGMSQDGQLWLRRRKKAQQMLQQMQQI